MKRLKLNQLLLLQAFVCRKPSGEWHYALTDHKHSWICK